MMMVVIMTTMASETTPHTNIGEINMEATLTATDLFLWM
jgi:hypothetical protein